MAAAILLFRLAVTWLIVLKQLDEAIASLMAQLKYGQAEWTAICPVPTLQSVFQENVLLINV